MVEVHASGRSKGARLSKDLAAVLVPDFDGGFRGGFVDLDVNIDGLGQVVDDVSAT